MSELNLVERTVLNMLAQRRSDGDIAVATGLSLAEIRSLDLSIGRKLSGKATPEYDY